MSKLKSAGLSLLAAGVLVAGAAGLSAQRPNPANDQNKLTRERLETMDVFDAEAQAAQTTARPSGDAVERIARLAREARDRQAAGDAKEARQALRRLHAAAYDWEDALADGAATRPARPATTAAMSGAPASADLAPAVGGGLSGTLSGTATPAPAAGRPGQSSRVSTAGSGDLEARMRDLERKMDRLIQALDGAKPSPTPRPGGEPK